MKDIVKILLFCCVGIFISCGEDDSTKGVEQKDDNMHISTVFPERMRNMEMDAFHKLRCILELRDQSHRVVYRQEKAVETDASDLVFDFPIEVGTYKCIMWADYIDVSSTPTGNEETMRYADKYYNTEDLEHILITNAVDMVNNDACDAFFYSCELIKEQKFLQQEISLQRAITKISLKENNLKEFGLVTAVTANFAIPETFDAVSGKVSDTMVEINYKDNAFDPTSSSTGTLLSVLAFADDAERAMGEISLTVNTQRLDPQVIPIPSSLIPMVRGQHIEVSANMLGISPDPDVDFDITFEINIKDWAENNQTVEVIDARPKVGDFFYADGTFSSNYLKDVDNPCIGVVFAVAHDGGKASVDSPSNYIDNNGIQKLDKVRGWVIAAKDFYNNTGFGALVNASVAVPDGLSKGKGDILGFMNTELIKRYADIDDFPAAKFIVHYENDEATKAPKGTSGWYWGAAGQYQILLEEYAVAETGSLVEKRAVMKSLEILEECNAGNIFPENGNGRRLWYSTNTDSKEKGIKFGFACLGIGNKDFGALEDDWASPDSKYNVRPMLTF